jgi:ribosomal protein L11 methyltransferase
MTWFQLSYTCTASNSPRLSELLSDSGALSVTISDGGEEVLCEPAPDSEPLWVATRLTGLFESKSDVRAAIASVHDAFAPEPTPTHSVEELEDQDWERTWMERFHPMRFGDRLWVCPSWIALPDPLAVNIIVDPGRAFGTGCHESTALCLEWLEEHTMMGGLMIDYGCGSGILAVAGVRLGFGKAYAVDVDQDALQTSRDNASCNGVEGQVVVSLPDALPHLQADVVMANILAGPLMELAPTIAGLTRCGGHVVLAGILMEQSEAVMRAYEPYLMMDNPEVRNDWVRLSGVRTAVEAG